MYNSFVTPWTMVCQAPLSMGFPRQKYWSGLPFPPPGDLPTQGLNPHLLRCRQILCHWAFSPADLEWKRRGRQRQQSIHSLQLEFQWGFGRLMSLNSHALLSDVFFYPFEFFLSVFSLSSKSTLSFLAGETKTRKCRITFFSVAWFLESFLIISPPVFSFLSLTEQKAEMPLTKWNA